MSKKLTWYAYVSDDMSDIEVRLRADSIDEADGKIKQFKNLKGFFCAFSYPD
jgi:hypothetical protein